MYHLLDTPFFLKTAYVISTQRILLDICSKHVFVRHNSLTVRTEIQQFAAEQTFLFITN